MPPTPTPSELAPYRLPRGHAVPVGVLVALLTGLLLVLVCVSAAVGSVAVPVGEVLAIVGRRLPGGPAPQPGVTEAVVWQFRLPRVALAAVVGGALAVAGAALQALVRNPLADPFLLGTSAGGAFGAVCTVVLGAGAVGGLSRSAAAVVGALAATLLVLALGSRAGRVAPTRLVLVGVAVAALFQSGTSFLQLVADPLQVQGVLFWLLGTVSGASWSQLGLPGLTLLLTTAWLVLSGRRLNALLLGDDSARGTGVDPSRLRLEVVVATALLTGSVVAVAGAVAFVGLLVPHLVRLVVGADHRRLLPVSVLVGACYLVLVDLVARTVLSPTELPLGIVTGALGAPALVLLLRRTAPEAAR